MPRSVRPRSPLNEPWDPLKAMHEYRNSEITRWDYPKPPLAAQSTHKAEYTAPPQPPQKAAGKKYSGVETRAFDATSTHKEAYVWHDCPPRSSPPLGMPYNPPKAWPVVSYHGDVTASEKAFRDAVIDEEEERAWRTQAKLLPERCHAFHGEDERKAIGKEPLTCAHGGYASRARQPQKNGKPEWTRNGTGSSYAAPRTEHAHKHMHKSAVMLAKERKAVTEADPKAGLLLSLSYSYSHG